MIRTFVHNILVLHGLTFGKNYKLGFWREKKMKQVLSLNACGLPSDETNNGTKSLPETMSMIFVVVFISSEDEEKKMTSQTVLVWQMSFG
jgi:hypothetical protein